MYRRYVSQISTAPDGDTYLRYMSPMKHAGAAALDQLEPLLARVRALSGLKEKGRGVFYRGGKAFLHFHEDAAGLFADVRLVGTEFERFRVETEGEQSEFLSRVAGEIAR